MSTYVDEKFHYNMLLFCRHLLIQERNFKVDVSHLYSYRVQVCHLEVR